MYRIYRKNFECFYTKLQRKDRRILNTSAYHIRYCTKGLEYYYMNHLDVWEHLKRSNGFKSSRDIWFMAEPISEVWISLVVGMQKYSRYDNWFQINDEIKIQMNAFANVNRHFIDIFTPKNDKLVNSIKNVL